MRGRTVILVSHHVQLCAPGAKFIVALDNGRVEFSGDYDTFHKSTVMKSLVQSSATESMDDKDEKLVEGIAEEEMDDGKSTRSRSEANPQSSSASTLAGNGIASDSKTEKKKPRKLVEEETRAVGRIKRDVWETYFKACGGGLFWFLFIFIMVAAAITPVLENGWLKLVLSHLIRVLILILVFPRVWSGASENKDNDKGPLFYIVIYAIVRPTPSSCRSILDYYRSLWLVWSSPHYDGSPYVSTEGIQEPY
jgi:hypothetical protein